MENPKLNDAPLHGSKENNLNSNSIAANDEIEEVDDCPIEEVRLVVPITDDPTQPVLTFRAWVLGLAFCVALAFCNQFFSYRENPLTVSAVTAQIATLPLGKLMAATLPTKVFSVPMTNWKFTMNPGPFGMKEHALTNIIASSGVGGVYAVHIVTMVKAFYHRQLNPIAAFLLSQTTQMLGYGWAGMFRTILVDSPYMWWPAQLVSVSLYRALHEKDKRKQGGVTRLQFFLITMICSLGYYVIPGYLFPSISALSIVCWIWKDSIRAQQLGAGVNGMGLGAFGLDWSAVANFLSSPLAFPPVAIVNVLVGFVLIVYVITPLSYFTNTYEAKKFPFISSKTFDAQGKKFNITRILNQETFDINLDSYNGYSKLYVSAFFALAYGLNFASLTACLSHVALFHGDTIKEMWQGTVKKKGGDIHTRIMKRNYKQVPHWWFYIIIVIVVGLGLWACEGFNKQLQLPWWGLLLACAMAAFFTLPVGVIQATTNMGPGLNVITELVIGYIYPGKPLANVTFKTYGYISMLQALAFVQDFKLGHYMKIPPRSMFFAQIVGTFVATSVYFGTAWWMLETIDHICDPALLPEGSPWTCPGDAVFYSASIIWGVVGPGRMFTDKGIYPEINWFFLFGILAPVPVWLLSKKFPENKYIKMTIMPIIIGATAQMPPARPMNYVMWGTVGLFFNVYIFKRYKNWWTRYTYILSAGLDAGVAFMAILLYFSLQTYDLQGPSWWGLKSDDHCPLATCPTAPGIVAKGCPVL